MSFFTHSEANGGTPHKVLVLAVELLASILAFAVANALLRPELQLDPIDITGSILRGVTFRLGGVLSVLNIHRTAWVSALERTFEGTGLNMILTALLLRFAPDTAAPLEEIMVGGLLAGLLGAGIRYWGSRPPQGSIVIVGFNPVAEGMMRDLGATLRGVVGASPDRLPAGVVHLGGFEDLADLVRQKKPRQIVLVDSSLLRQQASLVSAWRQQGISVDPLAAAYEQYYERVCTEALTQAEVLRSAAMAASPAMMSLQATYSNLVGLAFMIMLAPLMMLLAVLSRLAAGPGPILHRVECAGFQGIPFQRLYFRIRSARTGKLHWIGRIIALFRMTGLPQLINLIRGEMAMFGPTPARIEFSHHLGKVIPGYSHRVTMRPGLMGWAQVQMRTREIQEETLRLEHDLYYIKQCSPLMDLEILLRTLLRSPVWMVRGRK